MIIPIANLDATVALGRKLGALLMPGDVVALIGPLGAGKTHLVRAIAEGLEIKDSAVVTSPTFVLIQEYEAKFPVYHFDAYRLKDEREFAALGAEEYLFGDGICLIEWADRVVGGLPEEHLRIEIQPDGEEKRIIHITPVGERFQSRFAAGRL